MMMKRILLVFLLVVIGASSFALVRGLQSEQESLAKVGQAVEVPANLEVKDAVSIGGPVVVSGRVIKDAVSIGSSVYLKDNASVGGDAVSIGGRVFKSPKATVGGEIVEINVKQFAPAAAYVGKNKLASGLAVFGLLNLVGLIVLVALLVAFFTPQLGRISGVIERDIIKNFFWGLLIFILVIPITLALLISIIGIVLIPLWLLLVAAAVVFGYIAAGHLVGKRVLNALRIRNQSMMTETLTGVIILWLIGLIPLVGWLIQLIAHCCGLGAASLTRFGTR